MEIDIEKLKSDFKKEFMYCNECEIGDKVKTDLYTIIGILIECIDKQNSNG